MEVGTKVKIVQIPTNDQLYHKTGVWAGWATTDKYTAIIILDEPLPNALAITIPVVCLERT